MSKRYVSGFSLCPHFTRSINFLATSVCGANGESVVTNDLYNFYGNNTVAYSLWDSLQTTSCVCGPGYTGVNCLSSKLIMDCFLFRSSMFTL